MITYQERVLASISSKSLFISLAHRLVVSHCHARSSLIDQLVSPAIVTRGMRREARSSLKNFTLLLGIAIVDDLPALDACDDLLYSPVPHSTAAQSPGHGGSC